MSPLYRPLVFMLCLVPFLGCAGGILAGAGVAALPGFDLGADPPRFVLDTLGKTALNLLFITLAISPLQWLTRDRVLLRLRRMLGLFTFGYALLHFLTYLGPFQAFDWHEIGKDLSKRPYIVCGFLALLLLAPLAATSSDRMQRRLGRRWSRLHRLIYLIAPLVVVHFWKMLKHEYREPLLYAAMLALLLGLRLWRGRRRVSAATSMCAPPKARERA